MANFCSRCGAPIQFEDVFCGRCGTGVHLHPAEAFTTLPVVAIGDPLTPDVGNGGMHRRSVLITAVALALVAAMAVAIVLLVRGDGSQQAVAGTGTPAASASTAAPPPAARSTAATTPKIDPKIAKAQREYRAFLRRLENMLRQSASGRVQLGSVLAGVENGCATSPYTAAQQIRTVIDNRTSILNQLSGLTAPPNSEGERVSSLLQQALQASINADVQYKAWMDYLYTDYYYTVPVGCPNGTPPHDGAYAAALAADSQASNLKSRFVAAFNPVARRFGLRTWRASGF